MHTISYYLYKMVEDFACQIQLYSYVVIPMIVNTLN